MFQIDGFSGINNIFIVGTTNRLDLIDSALLRYFFLSFSLSPLPLSLSLFCTYSPLCSNHRPGRLELLVEVGDPDEEGRNQILKAHTQNLGSLLEPGVILEEIGKVATLLYS